MPVLSLSKRPAISEMLAGITRKGYAVVVGAEAPTTHAARYNFE